LAEGGDVAVGDVAEIEGVEGSQRCP
jgi:hypothetical protein